MSAPILTMILDVSACLTSERSYENCSHRVADLKRAGAPIQVTLLAGAITSW